MFRNKEIQELKKQLVDCRMTLNEDDYKISRLKVDNERLKEVIKILTEKISNGHKGQLELLNSAVEGFLAGVPANELLWTLSDANKYFTDDKEG